MVTFCKALCFIPCLPVIIIYKCCADVIIPFFEKCCKVFCELVEKCCALIYACCLWIEQNIIKPVKNAIGACCSWLSENVFKPLCNCIETVVVAIYEFLVKVCDLIG